MIDNGHNWRNEKQLDWWKRIQKFPLKKIGVIIRASNELYKSKPSNTYMDEYSVLFPVYLRQICCRNQFSYKLFTIHFSDLFFYKIFDFVEWAKETTIESTHTRPMTSLWKNVVNLSRSNFFRVQKSRRKSTQIRTKEYRVVSFLIEI